MILSSILLKPHFLTIEKFLNVLKSKDQDFLEETGFCASYNTIAAKFSENALRPSEVARYVEDGHKFFSSIEERFPEAIKPSEDTEFQKAFANARARWRLLTEDVDSSVDKAKHFNLV